ncbi:MAG: hypothetical protein ABH919_02405 [bacterium]
MNKKQYFQQSFSKLWLYFVIAIFFASWGSLFGGDRCKPALRFHTMEEIHDFILGILLFLIPITFIFIILSFFIKLGAKKFFAISLFLSLAGFLIFGFTNEVSPSCPDYRRVADIKQLMIAETMYFEKYQRYAPYEELQNSGIMPVLPQDPQSGEYYPLILSEDRQSFEIKAKLDDGTVQADKDGYCVIKEGMFKLNKQCYPNKK